jgi:hypothetical protein
MPDEQPPPTPIFGGVTVGKTTFPVEFAPAQRVFTATVDGRAVLARDWETLEQKVADHARKARTKVAIRFVDPATLREGLAYGLHATRGVPLIQWTGGDKTAGEITYPLSVDVDRKELVRLRTAAKAAAKKLNDFERAARIPNCYQLTDLVEKEIGRVTEAARRAREDVPK